MITLQLDTYLEPLHGNTNQQEQEIANYIESSQRWLSYVDRVNQTGVPSLNGFRPIDQWFEAQTFHPNDLISEACEALDFYTEPDDLTLSMNYLRK